MTVRHRRPLWANDLFVVAIMIAWNILVCAVCLWLCGGAK
jgi:hypothetical protein